MIVSFAGGFEPGCLGGETCDSRELEDCWLSARESIHIVYGFVRRWVIVKVRFDVLKYTDAVGNGVRCVERLCSSQSVE